MFSLKMGGRAQAQRLSWLEHPPIHQKKKKSLGFNSQSGHKPRLQVQSWSGRVEEEDNQCFSLSLSLSLSLNKHILK